MEVTTGGAEANFIAAWTLIEPGDDGFRRNGARVVGRGSSIARIEEAAPGAEGRYAGAYVIPGLTDMHVHLTYDDAFTVCTNLSQSSTIQHSNLHTTDAWTRRVSSNGYNS